MTANAALAADLQAEALIAEIERQAGVQRQQLLEVAARECAEIRQRARVKARRQMQRALDDLRRTERRQMQQLRAELETAARRQASQRQLELLAAAWPRLSDALERRWHDAPARLRWMQRQIALARARLPVHGWVVHHPASCSDGEIAALREHLGAQGLSEVSLRADAGQRAGLVIEVGGARLDGTPAALLADRSRAEAALLVELEGALTAGAGP